MSLPNLALPPLPTIRDLLRLYKLRAMRQLSQNFIMDERITDKIVKAAGKIKGGHICEVGPGPGNITRSIIKRSPNSLYLVEKDIRFSPFLEMLKDCAPCEINIINENVLSLNYQEFFPKNEAKGWSDETPNIHLIGNLPFNIATPLIIKWLKAISERSSAWAFGRVQMTLTFQKEVAERIVAPILSSQRCRLSLMAQNWCHVDHKFTIPGKAFVPKPKVDVGVVHFIPLKTPLVDEPFHFVENVCRSLFSFRQKYCCKSLGTLFHQSKREKLTMELLERASIPKETRAFQITHQELDRICQAYKEMLLQDPSLETYNYRRNSRCSYLPIRLISSSPLSAYRASARLSFRRMRT